MQREWELWDMAAVALLHPPLAQRGSMAGALFQHSQCGETGTSRAVTAVGKSLSLLLNEVNVKRSKQWSQGYSSNEVSSGKGEMQLCLFTGRERTDCSAVKAPWAKEQITSGERDLQ